MKIKIIKCSEEYWWYRKRIGEILEVEPTYDERTPYCINLRKGEKGLVLKEDAEVIE